MRRIGVLFGISALFLAGCSSASSIEPASERSSEAPAYGALTAAQKADGYHDMGNGVVVRWANESEKSEAKCASYAESCFKLAVQTNVTCSRGVYIELQVKTSSGTIIGKANEITPAMRKGDRGVFAIVTADKGASKASIADINCLG